MTHLILHEIARKSHGNCPRWWCNYILTCIFGQIRLFRCQRGIEDWGNCPVRHLLAANNRCDFKQGVGDPPHYTMENKWRPLRHLPAITENRCCDLTGQRARGPRFMANIRVVWVPAKLSTARVPGRGCFWLFGTPDLYFTGLFCHISSLEQADGQEALLWRWRRAT